MVVLPTVPLPPSVPPAFTVTALAVLVPLTESRPPLTVVAPVKVLVPVTLVAPLFAVSVMPPPRLFSVPPLEVTAPVNAPLANVPPDSETILIVCPSKPRSSVPPVLIVVALVALNVFAAAPLSVPALIVVAPV